MAYTNITADQLIRELWRIAVSETLKNAVAVDGGFHIGQTNPNPDFGDKPDYRFVAITSDQLCAMLTAIGCHKAVDHLTPKIGGRFWSGQARAAAEWIAENQPAAATA